MAVDLTPELRKRLDEHLDAVEAALVAAGNLREQRRGVLDDLEAQILDMLAARSQTPTVEDMEAILGQIDPPAAYGAKAGEDLPVAPPDFYVPRHSVPGVISFVVFCTVGLGEIFIVVCALSNMLHDLVEGVGLWGLLICFVGFIFGLVGAFQKGRKRWLAIAGLLLNGLVVAAVMGLLLETSAPRSSSLEELRPDTNHLRTPHRISQTRSTE